MVVLAVALPLVAAILVSMGTKPSLPVLPTIAPEASVRQPSR
jgi:hypothetical protein